jgi:DNA helicase-2/ATP-dependent DNA helicase PcrA
MPDRAHEGAYLREVGKLNGSQREALLEPGNTVVLAGPGSGKTATLVLKIARLLDEIPAPRGVACLTYGNEAAREFEARLGALGVRRSSRLFTGTVHAFCLAHVLRPFASRLPGRGRLFAEFEVAGDEETARAREKGLDAAGVNEPESWWSAKLSAYRRVVLIDPSKKDEFDDRLPVVAEGYRKALREARLIDFDDIVIASLKLIETDEHVRRVLVAKFPWFVIDEYQDLGLALHRIVMILMDQAHIGVFAVGDPDQSIYGFTGARPEFFDALANRKDVRRVNLELNYRCRQEIIDASLHILQPEQERGFQAAPTDEPETGDIIFHECPTGLAQQAAETVARVEELVAAGVLPGEVGILTTRWQDQVEFQQRLDAQAIPYRIARGPTYKATPLTMWIENMAAWCAGGWHRGSPRLAELFATWESTLVTCRGERRDRQNLTARITLYQLLRSLREPRLPVGTWLNAIDGVLELRRLAADVTSAPVRVRHDLRELGVLLRSLDKSPQPIDEFSGIARDKVVLQSIHGSKGLQYTAIFIPALEAGVLPRYGDDPREARRLFYVAITRARREVHLLWSGFWYTAKGQLRSKGPSHLLLELGGRLRPATRSG